MTNVNERDYFTDTDILKDSNEYFNEMLARSPVYESQVRDLLIVTGYEESVQVLLNSDDFSSVVSVAGPVVPLPFEPVGSDISEQIEAHRSQVPATDLVVTFDGINHANARAILNKLFVPSRLKANEEFMKAYANQLVTEFVSKGKFELVMDVGVPFVTMVVAELLGIPEENCERFKQVIASTPPPGNVNNAEEAVVNHALMFIAGELSGLVSARRDNPGADIMSELANATYPDGTLPPLEQVVTLATFLFAAGQDTSAKLLGNCMRILTEDLELQERLRQNLDAIPAFIEEVLRLDGSTKATFRIAKRDTQIAGVAVPAGKRVAILLGAGNLDERRWEDPKAFRLDRPRAREHLGFGRGKHTCIGAPLARAELKYMIEILLRTTSRITMSEAHHGPAGMRDLHYEPSYIIRGLEALHLIVEPSNA